tara:strand:- start:535 stop:897 length:363 start_codon:yes stop_codon:yes gene_type:complete
MNASSKSEKNERLPLSAERRKFLQRSGMSAVAAMTAGATATLTASAATQVDESSAQAVALGYRHDAAQVDGDKFPKRNAIDVCRNCALFKSKTDVQWGACPLFGADEVNRDGWCSAWAKG